MPHRAVKQKQPSLRAAEAGPSVPQYTSLATSNEKIAAGALARLNIPAAGVFAVVRDVHSLNLAQQGQVQRLNSLNAADRTAGFTSLAIQNLDPGAAGNAFNGQRQKAAAEIANLPVVERTVLAGLTSGQVNAVTTAVNGFSIQERDEVRDRLDVTKVESIPVGQLVSALTDQQRLAVATLANLSDAERDLVTSFNTSVNRLNNSQWHLLKKEVEETGDGYSDRVSKYIPAEVVSAYLAIDGLIQVSGIDGAEGRILKWCMFAFFVLVTAALVGFFSSGTAGDTARNRPQIFVSTVAFIVWAFALGGPFEDLFESQKFYSSLLLVVYTFLVTAFLPGQAPMP